MMMEEDLNIIAEILPELIKIEIIKEKLEELYKHEKVSNSYDLIGYYKLAEILQILNISEESKTEIYRWAKTKRKEFGLNDNLFNVHSGLIRNPLSYDKINEKIKTLKNI